ncbi:MAG: SURF1 family cytochrome oxidase biogenesis protein [Croceibacterium sp.]
MTRRVPLVPTLVVAAAVAAMIALGVWQGFVRLPEKEAAIARYERAQTMNSDVAWPRTAAERERALYRHTRVACVRVLSLDAVAGRSLRGEPGWAHVAKCELDSGGVADIAIGWSAGTAAPTWTGGEMFGVVAPVGRKGVRLVAGPPAAGLAPLASPDPRDVANNHFSYMIQWFLFAGTAVVIYALALRKRWRDRAL